MRTVSIAALAALSMACGPLSAQDQMPQATAPLGQVSIDPATAERALERALVTVGASLLSEGSVEIETSLFYAREDRTIPFTVVPDGLGGFTDGSVDLAQNTLEATLGVRAGLGHGLQLEADIPFATSNLHRVSSTAIEVTEDIDDTTSGIGDVVLGLAATLIEGSRDLPTIIARLSWDSDTGDQNDQALGSGFDELTGQLVFIRRQDPLVFVLSTSLTHTFEEDAIQPGNAYAASFNTLLAVSPRTSLSAGIRYAYQEKTESLGVDLPGTEESRASLLLGGNTVIGQGIVLGIDASAGLTEDATDFTVGATLSFRL